MDSSFDTCFITQHVICLGGWLMWTGKEYLWRKCSIYVKSIWSNMSFKASVFLWVFCLDDLTIDVPGKLKFLTVDSGLSIWAFCKCLYVVDVFTIMSSYWIVPFVTWWIPQLVFILKSFFFFFFFLISIATWLHCHLYGMFVHTFTFSLNTSLGLEWVSCRQLTEGFY